jgi:hypothetical protein
VLLACLLFRITRNNMREQGCRSCGLSQPRSARQLLFSCCERGSLCARDPQTVGFVKCFGGSPEVEGDGRRRRIMAGFLVWRLRMILKQIDKEKCYSGIAPFVRCTFVLVSSGSIFEIISSQKGRCSSNIVYLCLFVVCFTTLFQKVESV